MSKIVDFKCEIASLSGFSPAILEKYQPKFPESYTEPEAMAVLSQAVKKETGNRLCILPFCHTLEAEAYGGIINLSEGVYGPRAKEYACQSFDDLLNLPDFDLKSGRIGGVLTACRNLKAKGEKVGLLVTGFNTTLNNLIDTSKFYKNFRKRPDDCDKILKHLSKNLQALMEEAIAIGVDVICYSDPAGGVSIIGPKYSEKIVGGYVLPLLKSVSEKLGDKTIINLCPKSTWVLLGLDMAEKEYVDYPAGINYIEACLQEIGKSKILGQACIKNAGCTLRGGRVWRINLK
ncbi:MAG: uroporphyrinogen decarboxylase family protein [Bacillota bacterium]